MGVPIPPRISPLNALRPTAPEDSFLEGVEELESTEILEQLPKEGPFKTEDLIKAHDRPAATAGPAPLPPTEIVKLANGDSMLRLKDMPKAVREAASVPGDPLAPDFDGEEETAADPLAAESAYASPWDLAQEAKAAQDPGPSVDFACAVPEAPVKKQRKPRVKPPTTFTTKPLQPGDEGYEEGFQAHSSDPEPVEASEPAKPAHELFGHDDRSPGVIDAWDDPQAKQLIQALDPSVYSPGATGPHGGIVMRSDLGLTDQLIGCKPAPGYFLENGFWKQAALPAPAPEPKKQYDGLDHFVTPEWVVKACLSTIPRSPAPTMILDAGAGTGTWGVVARDLWPHAHIVGAELDHRHREGFLEDEHGIVPTNLIRDGKPAGPSPYSKWYEGDFLHMPAFDDREWWRQPGSYDLVMSNPPFNQVTDFVRMACHMANPDGGRVVMVLRLAILESQIRAKDFWPYYPPEHITIFSKRPSFTGDGKTDAKTPYTAVVWRNGFRGDPTFRWFDPEQTDRLITIKGREPGQIMPEGWKPPVTPQVPEA